MKKTLSILSLFAVIAVFIAGCAANSDDPKAVLKTFFERISKKDIDGAAQLATADSKSTLDMVKKGIDMADKMKDSLPQNDPMKEFQDAEFGEAKINGNTATVTVTNKSKKDQPPADFTLVKQDGKWKVDFSMATLMKMGQQQINNGAVPPAGASGTPDSLHMSTEDMEKATQMADSVMKNLDPKQLEEIQKQLDDLNTELKTK